MNVLYDIIYFLRFLKYDQSFVFLKKNDIYNIHVI